MGNRGGRRQLETLYRARYERFFRVAMAIVGEQAGAHDAVQDGFARALKGIRSFDGSGPLEGWVWRIVVNAALASRRSPLLVSDEVDQFVQDGNRDELGVRGRIAGLPERQRLVVFLRYYADLDYRAIAAALDIEVGTVSATLSAAHATLRKQLKEVVQ